jgi:AcrR family transcriptional regulator
MAADVALAAPTTGATPTTREALVLTAERLFALHGIDGVPIRQILLAAGVANKSAVQYHFESKDGLVRAILDHRAPYLTERRRLLWEQAPANDLRAAIEAQFLPVAELAELDGSYYLTFVEQLDLRREHADHPFDQLPPTIRARYRDDEERIGALLPHVPEAVRTRRHLQASALNLHLCAARERAHRRGEAQLPLAVHVNELLDLLIGVLAADVSDRTLAALADAERSPTARTRSGPRLD